MVSVVVPWYYHGRHGTYHGRHGTYHGTTMVGMVHTMVGMVHTMVRTMVYTPSTLAGIAPYGRLRMHL
jgi:hypothetical protein